MRQSNSFNHCLTADHMARLRALADQWGVSRSEMIRRLIDAAWRDRRAPEPETPRERQS